MICTKATQYADVTCGAYKLSEIQKEQCKKEEDIPITSNLIIFAAEKFKCHIVEQPIATDQDNLDPNKPQPPPVKKDYILGQKYLISKDNYLYFKINQDTHSTGDFRIKFSKILCGPITLMGQQQNETIETYDPDHISQVLLGKDDINADGCCGGCQNLCNIIESMDAPIGKINWAIEEKCDKNEALSKQLFDYEFKTWIKRLCGFCFFWVGVWFMLSPFYQLLYWFPLVGKYLGTVGSFICSFVGFLIAIPFTLLVISIAWLFFRKEIGIPLLCISLIIFGCFIFANKNPDEEQKTSFLQYIT